MNTFNSGWYLIYTKPRHEKKVNAYLDSKSITSFLPLTKKLRIWHDRKKFVDEPLFPSYIFVYLKDLKSYYEGIDADGYLYYVRAGGRIVWVDESIINNIKLVTERADDIEISNSRFEPGRKLIINAGALTGLSCEVIKVDSKHKLLVRVDLLQRNILLRLPKESLIAG